MGLRRDVFLRGLVCAVVFAPRSALASSVVAEADIAAAEAAAEAAIAARLDKIRAEFAPRAQALRPNAELRRIARARSRQLSLGAPFSHQDFEGRYPAIEMVRAAFGPYGYIGENIAMEQRGDRRFDPDRFAADMTRNWMNSAEHRDNILSPDFDSSGIGVVLYRNQAFATQVFRGAPPPPPRRTRPVRPPPMRGGIPWPPAGH